MKIKPMLGEFALDHIEYIESSESRALVEHRVPGLAGNYFQDMGTVPNTIVIHGAKHGDEARDRFLESIREIFNAGEQTIFVADINTATDITDVVIGDLQVAEIGGSTDSFRYMIKLRKYIEPPEPPATGLLDAGILDDALSLTDALDLIDSLSSMSNLGDPTEPLRGVLDGIKTASGGLDQTVNDLRDLFGEEAPGAAEPGLAGTVPSAEDLRIDPADPRIDGTTRAALQSMLESPETADTAAGLIQGVNQGKLAGIFDNTSSAATALAAAHSLDLSELIPDGQDAVLVLDALSPLNAPPTILVRTEVREDPARLSAALDEVAQTFGFFQRGELGPCDSTASAIPVPNLVPSSYCQVPVVAPTPGDDIIEDKSKGAPPATPRELTYTQEDVIDDHISIPAQHSLVRLSKNPDTSADAVGMLEAVKSRQLEGIYCVNWQKSALRARKLNSDWWTVIPGGEDAVLMLDPEDLQNGPPMIAFRHRLHKACGLSDNEEPFPNGDARLDAALKEASTTFELWQMGALVPCDNTTRSVPNLVPPSFCRLPDAPPGITPVVHEDAIRVKIVEEGTERPVQGLTFLLQLPGGEIRPVSTDASGVIEVADAGGTSILRSDLAGATIETTWHLTEPAEPVASALAAAAGGSPTVVARTPLNVGLPPEFDPERIHVAVIVAHQVRTGETLDSIASEHGLTRSELVRFNVGNEDPEAVRAYLYDVVGSTFVDANDEPLLRDSDRPGVIHVPRQVERPLEAGVNHRLQLRIVQQGYAAHPIPVYMGVLADEASVLDRPESGGSEIGTLTKGQLIRILEERFNNDRVFVRFVGVESSQKTIDSYVRGIREGPEEWLELAPGGLLVANYADAAGSLLSAPDEEDAPLIDFAPEGELGDV